MFGLFSPRWLRLLTALVLAMVVMPFGMSRAAAEDANLGGIQITITRTDGSVSTYDGTKIFAGGEAAKVNIKLSRDQIPAGQTVEVTFSGPISIPNGPVPLSSEVALFVQSATMQDGKLSITFKSQEDINKVDPTIGQVMLGVGGTITQTDTSHQDTITWTTQGKSDATAVIVTKPGDSPRPSDFTTTMTKSGWFNAGDAWDKVTVVDGKVILGDQWIGKTATYTVTVATTSAYRGTLTDTVSAPLSPVSGSFSGTLTSWDANGLNKTDTSYALTPTIDGQTSTIPVDLPANSRLVITYQASIKDAAALAELQKQLQAKYDATNPKGGWISVSPGNTVTAPGFQNTTTTVGIGVSTPSTGGGTGTPTPVYDEGAFSKSVNPSWKLLDEDANGVLEAPVPVTYTLTADLAKLVSQSTADHPLLLTQNVLITDTLPSNTRWMDQAPDFIASSGMALSRTTVSCDAATMRSDAQVGTYCVSGQTLIANVGKDRSTNVSVSLRAEIHDLTGANSYATGSDWRTGKPATIWQVGNEAKFAYEQVQVSRSVTVELVHSPGYEGQNNHAFAKSIATVTQPSSVVPATPGSVTYSFFLQADGLTMNKDFVGLRITDHLDTTIFDMTQGDQILASITGMNGFWDDGVRITQGSGLAATLDADGLLTITLTEGLRSSWAAANRTLPGAIKILVTVPTKVFDQPIDVSVTNHANLLGSDNTPLNYSEATQRFDSWGSVVSEQKFVRTRTSGQTGEWVDSARVQLNPDGTPVDPYAVYRIEIAAHKDWNSTINEITDVLPSSVTFVGFVDDSQVDQATRRRRADPSTSTTRANSPPATILPPPRCPSPP